MKNLLSIEYLFSVLPGDPNIGFWRIVMICAAVAVVFGILALILAQKKKNDGLRRHLWQRYAAWGLTFGLVSLVLAFFRLQNAYLLSMRAFIFIWLAFSAFWVLRIAIFHIWKFPKKLRARDEKAFFDQYLPHKKK